MIAKSVLGVGKQNNRLVNPVECPFIAMNPILVTAHCNKVVLAVWEHGAALPWLEKAVERGNAMAKYQLGKLLLLGAETVPKDVDRALKLLTECAEDGNQFAQYTLGKAYLLDEDVPQDQGQAVHWLELSAQQGNQYAKYYLNRVYSSIFSSTASLLYHMGRIFQDQRPQPVADIRAAVDSKLRRIREKKIAMGRKPDDHEEEQRMG